MVQYVPLSHTSMIYYYVFVLIGSVCCNINAVRQKKPTTESASSMVKSRDDETINPYKLTMPPVPSGSFDSFNPDQHEFNLTKSGEYRNKYGINRYGVLREGVFKLGPNYWADEEVMLIFPKYPPLRSFEKHYGRYGGLNARRFWVHWNIPEDRSANGIHSGMNSDNVMGGRPPPYCYEDFAYIPDRYPKRYYQKGEHPRERNRVKRQLQKLKSVLKPDHNDFIKNLHEGMGGRPPAGKTERKKKKTYEMNNDFEIRNKRGVTLNMKKRAKRQVQRVKGILQQENHNFLNIQDKHNMGGRPPAGKTERKKRKTYEMSNGFEIRNKRSVTLDMNANAEREENKKRLKRELDSTGNEGNMFSKLLEPRIIVKNDSLKRTLSSAEVGFQTDVYHNNYPILESLINYDDSKVRRAYMNDSSSGEYEESDEGERDYLLDPQMTTKDWPLRELLIWTKVKKGLITTLHPDILNETETFYYNSNSSGIEEDIYTVPHMVFDETTNMLQKLMLESEPHPYDDDFTTVTEPWLRKRNEYKRNGFRKWMAKMMPEHADHFEHLHDKEVEEFMNQKVHGMQKTYKDLFYEHHPEGPMDHHEGHAAHKEEFKVHRDHEAHLEKHDFQHDGHQAQHGEHIAQQKEHDANREAYLGYPEGHQEHLARLQELLIKLKSGNLNSAERKELHSMHKAEERADHQEELTAHLKEPPGNSKNHREHLARLQELLIKHKSGRLNSNEKVELEKIREAEQRAADHEERPGYPEGHREHLERLKELFIKHKNGALNSKERVEFENLREAEYEHRKQSDHVVKNKDEEKEPQTQPAPQPQQQQQQQQQQQNNAYQQQLYQQQMYQQQQNQQYNNYNNYGGGMGMNGMGGMGMNGMGMQGVGMNGMGMNGMGMNGMGMGMGQMGGVGAILNAINNNLPKLSPQQQAAQAQQNQQQNQQQQNYPQYPQGGPQSGQSPNYQDQMAQNTQNAAAAQEKSAQDREAQLQQPDPAQDSNTIQDQQDQDSNQDDDSTKSNVSDDDNQAVQNSNEDIRGQIDSNMQFPNAYNPNSQMDQAAAAQM